jgi:dihydroneopterin aldolase
MSFAPDAAAGLRLVFVRHLEVQALLGVHAHEQTRPQRVILDLELAVEDPEAPSAEGPDRLARVVDYAAAAETARQIATSAFCARHEIFPLTPARLCDSVVNVAKSIT